jgi:teichuronic acid biosynthesis glycosyltransferase TuaG
MISILMPIYNGIEFIDESVTSIKKQTFKEWELIIGINGHPLDSEVYKKAKKYENGRIKVIELYPIKGKSAALNTMLEHCQYNWIALLDVDDIWLPAKLQSQIPYMSVYDVIGTQCNYFGEMKGSPNIPEGDISNYDFFRINPIINSSCLVKKGLCNWRREWEGIEDYDMWLRLWKNNKKFYNIPSSLVMHRIHRDSAFNAKGNDLQVHKLLEKHRLS